jgi:enolase
MIIKTLHAREIFDAQGGPTIECTIVLDSGVAVVSSVPRGASRGVHEAVELRDQDERLMGMGVTKAVAIINTDLAPLFVGKEVDCVQADEMMIQLDSTQASSFASASDYTKVSSDKTADTSQGRHFGANTMLAVSMAMYRAHAVSENIPLYMFIAYVCGFKDITLPIPMFNMINGGMHAYNGLPLQEHSLVPLGVRTMAHAVDIAAQCTMRMRQIIRDEGKSTAVGDEGGFACHFVHEKEALDLLMRAINNLEQTGDGVMAIALDCAASHMYDAQNNMYRWRDEFLSTDALIALYAQLADDYPLYALEDGLNETDYTGWQKLNEQLGATTMLIADDMCVTNPTRIAQESKRNIFSAVIIKPNQIGTVTEALQAVKVCQEHNREVIVSHRSTETNDDFIADFAVGVSAMHIKAGGFTRGEHMAKYNRLLAIEQELLKGCD